MPENVYLYNTRLLQIFVCNFKDLSEFFITQDTIYKRNEKFHFYKLPKGKLMVLLLQTNTNLWTTIRRYTPEKFEYYNKAIGKEFKIEIEKK